MKKLILIALVCSALGSSAQSYFGVKPIVSEPTCYGSTNGTIQLSTLGGTAPYQYAWSGGLVQGSNTQTGIGAGSYTVTVTDANNQTAAYTVIVAQPFEIGINETHNAPQQHGASNGSIATTVDGGTPNYTYEWSNGATTPDIAGLPAGTYTLTVTDEAGCTATVSQTLTQPGRPDPGVHIRNAGGTEGTRSLNVSGSSNETASVSSTELKSEDVQLYPNPASNAVTLKTGNVNNAQISVIDMNGQVVSEQKAESNETSLNVSGLQKGNYIVEIKTEDGNTVNKTITVVR